MKSLFTLTALFLSFGSFGQDYYSISTEDSSVSWRYPKNVEIKLTDDSGTRLLSLNEKSETISGTFELNITTPWSDEVELINRDHDKITISRVDHTKESTSIDPRPSVIPQEVNRSLTPSEKDKTKYNVEITFSNELFFSFKDGKASATQFGEPIEVKGAYLIRYDAGLLKFSFDPENGEIWYVFEK